MKLKCDDGIVRDFYISDLSAQDEETGEACCKECGETFGHHDTKILKPIFRKHTCEIERNDKKIYEG